MISRFVSLVLLLWALGFAAFAVLLPRVPAPGRTDAIVVLTGGAGRVERGVALLGAGQARRMLVSGVDRAVRPHELAREAKAPAALFACCVDLGKESVDTRSNGEETAAWIRRHGYRSVRLVTTDWHMPRARFELAHALRPDRITLLPEPVPSEPGLTVLMAEYNKYLLRRVAVLAGL